MEQVKIYLPRVDEAIQEYEHNPKEASDGEAALLTSERHTGPIHLLITDVVMPKSAYHRV